MDKVTGARTPLTTPSPSRSLDSDWIMNRENDIFLEIPPSSSVSSSPPPSSPVGSWSSTTALRVGRADKERFCLNAFFLQLFLSSFTALLVGRADEEQF